MSRQIKDRTVISGSPGSEALGIDSEASALRALRFERTRKDLNEIFGRSTEGFGPDSYVTFFSIDLSFEGEGPRVDSLINQRSGGDIKSTRDHVKLNQSQFMRRVGGPRGPTVFLVNPHTHAQP